MTKNKKFQIMLDLVLVLGSMTKFYVSIIYDFGVLTVHIMMEL